MCPQRDNVCEWCCLRCTDVDRPHPCPWRGARASLKATVNCLLENEEIEAAIVALGPDAKANE
jgi:hypothetical protein